MKAGKVVKKLWRSRGEAISLREFVRASVTRMSRDRLRDVEVYPSIADQRDVALVEFFRAKCMTYEAPPSHGLRTDDAPHGWRVAG